MLGLCASLAVNVVLINKALIEIPPKFAGRPPVFPGMTGAKMDWPGATGLAADVRAYGEWMRTEAETRIGRQYPKTKLPNGDEATVIAWIWARTVTCPNPVCGIEMPLVRSWWLGKKKNKEAWVQPIVVPDAEHPSGKRVDFEIGHTAVGPGTDSTVGRNGATCVACASAVDLRYVRSEGRGGRLGSSLMATVAEGHRERVYLAPDDEQRVAAAVPRPVDVPEGLLPTEALGFRVQNYGLTRWADLFTNRQLLALTTFNDLVREARERVLADALAAGAERCERLEAGGTGADAYADAVALYLGLVVSRLTDYQSGLTTWASNPQMEILRNLFARQAIPMAWDFAEGNPFADSSGSLVRMLEAVGKAVEFLHAGAPGDARQADAISQAGSGLLISTDPPYYDNIGYSDLSDFFYVWLRRSLRSVFPDLLSTILVPKSEELIANPYRHDGEDGARRFFEEGFREVFARARNSALPDFPVTVFYAFKQSDDGDDGTASTGWETLLDGMIRSGWAITATWPMRSERGGRMRDIGSNALASSIVLALRPRPEDAPITDRRGLIQALHDELPDALRKLQQGNVSPVDLPQAAIGPGMAVFSRYARVIENDGTPMSVRSALARINEILDQVLNEQEGDYDGATRFAIAWYRQYGYRQGAFGVADSLARARNTSVDAVRREGVITSAASKVKLLAPSELPEDYDVLTDERVGVWEVLHHLIARTETGGIQAAGAFLAEVQARQDGAIDLDLVKELAFLLFHVAEGNSWTQDALAFNNVATSWPEIIEASRQAPAEQQLGMNLEG